eukprot:2442551-Rhodomonas_salina.1
MEGACPASRAGWFPGAEGGYINRCSHIADTHFRCRGRAEGQDVKGLTLEGICELIAGAPVSCARVVCCSTPSDCASITVPDLRVLVQDLDPGLIGFENPEDEVVIKKHGTQLRFRAQPMHHQISVNSDKMKEKIMALRNTAKNIGIHEGLILRNCWTLFQDMNHSGKRATHIPCGNSTAKDHAWNCSLRTAVLLE